MNNLDIMAFEGLLLLAKSLQNKLSSPEPVKELGMCMPSLAMAMADIKELPDMATMLES